MDAMLRHLAAHHDPHDFPSTAYERQALIEAAGKRRLIEWQKEHRRYELTPIGLRRLKRGRGLGLPALAISGGIGAAVAAAALLMLWLPSDRSPGEHATLGRPVENVRAPDVTPDAPAPVPVTAASVTQPPQAPAEPEKSAEPVAPTEPGAEPTTPNTKWRVGKKFRHRTAKLPGRRHWNFGQRYRDERFPR